MGQFERPRGRLNEEEVPQDLLCAENVKNEMENFSFNIDSIPSSKRLSDLYEDVLQRSNVINMEEKGSILISRNRIKLGLNYVQSISEKALELDNYYKEREILYQENAKQEEIVLRPAPITEIALLEKPAGDEAENNFYFGAQCQINREIRKL